MATRLTGREAIELAEKNGWLLSVRADGSEPAREGVTVDEARRIAAADPDRVYVDFDETPGDPGVA
jgi:hypothetical protein